MKIMEIDKPNKRLWKGNVPRLFKAADEGPFLRAELVSAAGRGKLRVTYDWLYSALNCTPDDDTPFFWEFEKRSDGEIALSPTGTPAHVPDRVFASVRDDWDWHVQTQAPHSADWITSVARDERLRVHGSYVLSVAFQGFNGKYVAVDDELDRHDYHAGYRLRSDADEPVQSCVFRVQNTTVLQDHLDYLESYTIDESDVHAVADAYGLEMNDESVRKLTDQFPEITPERLQRRARAEVGGAEACPAEDVDEAVGDVGGTAVTTGATVGSVIGATVGFLMGGPYGALAGIFIGLGAGSNIGLGVELTDPKADPANVVDTSIPEVADTMRDISPAGGPYDNKFLWEDIFALGKFPQIGHPDRPDAGCLLPPADDGTARVWYPTSRTVGKPVTDPERYPPMRGVGFVALFVIVKTEAGHYQLRLHPDHALLNRPNRPNHSQLTQGSRFAAVLGGILEPPDSDKQMQVYAAGDLYYKRSGRIVHVIPKTGHYFVRDGRFNEAVLETTKRHLDALGYDTSHIEFERY